MSKTTVTNFAKPSDFSPDPLTDLLRAEASEFMEGHVHLLDGEGRHRWRAVFVKGVVRRFHAASLI